MKKQKFLSIMLCTAMLTFAGVVMTSCDGNDPDNYSYNNDDNDDNDNGYNNGWDDGSDDNGSGYNGGGNSGNDNGSGSGSGSDSGSGSSSETQKDVAPDAPTGVKASVQGPKKYPYVLVEWDYVSSGVDHYDIYRSTSKTGSFSKKATREGYCYNWADEDMQYNKTYYYKIKAVSKGGKASGFSETVGVWVEPYNE